VAGLLVFYESGHGDHIPKGSDTTYRQYGAMVLAPSNIKALGFLQLKLWESGLESVWKQNLYTTTS
jgi:hypothetical protein